MRKVSAEDFVRGWAKGGSMAEVAQRLGLAEVSVYQRAAALRKAGVKLPSLSGAREPIDVDALNKLLQG